MKQFQTPGMEYTVFGIGQVTRLILMATPENRGSVREQVEESIRVIRAVLDKQPHRLALTVQTVFLRNAEDETVCRRVFADYYGAEMPVTTYVEQPPCSGAALAVEAWAIGGDGVRLARLQPNVVTTSYDGITWTQCGGITPRTPAGGVYGQSLDVFQQMKSLLKKTGVEFDHVVRTWLYLGSITGPEGDLERYMELNRARAEFYRSIRFGRGHVLRGVRHDVYPASTGIGMNGGGLTVGCLALDTRRKDVFLLPLENPQQTPVYRYERIYSPKSPKFVRAMAVVIGDYVITWVSGTASIIQSKTQHPGDPAKQTEQTIANIERLIAPDNLARHGLPGAGSALSDLARVRVYVKRPQDYPVCRDICRERFGKVPILFTVADVCRSDLLVEMEGVAFSSRTSLG